MRARLQAMLDHVDIATNADPVCLLKNIKSIMTGFQSTTYAPMAIHEAKRELYRYTQAPGQSTSDYHRMFKSMVDVIKQNGGTLADRVLVEP